MILLDIQGIGELNYTPDVVRFTIHSTNHDVISANAVRANKKQTIVLLEQLTALGVDPKDITTTTFNIIPEYVKDSQKINYWSVIHYLSVQMNIAILDEVFQFLEDSSLSNIQFVTSKANELEDQCRKLAVKDALRKAKIYAEAADLKLLGINSITEPQSYNYYGGSVSMKASVESMGAGLSVGQQFISISINMKFNLQ